MSYTYPRKAKKVCLLSNTTDVISTGMYLSGPVYVEHNPFNKHIIDQTGTKIDVGVMVDPEQGFKSQVVYSDPVIPLCGTQPMP